MSVSVYFHYETFLSRHKSWLNTAVTESLNVLEKQLDEHLIKLNRSSVIIYANLT